MQVAVSPKRVREALNILILIGFLWIVVHFLLITTNQHGRRPHTQSHSIKSDRSKLHADIRDVLAKNFKKFNVKKDENNNSPFLQPFHENKHSSFQAEETYDKQSEAKAQMLEQLLKYSAEKYANTFNYYNKHGHFNREFKAIDFKEINKNFVIQSKKSSRNVTEIKTLLKKLRTFAQPPTNPPGCLTNYNCSLDSQFSVNFTVSMEAESFSQLKQRYPDVSLGGTLSSPGCNTTDRIALIIPYRDREEHLQIFIKNIIPFLQAQRKAFTIFVVEQIGEVLFNKAQMMNAGFLESQKLGNFSCFIFHDVDMIPLNLCNSYTCHPTGIRHLGLSITPNNPHMVYGACIGGVSAFTRQTFTTMNGFSNLFFGWGGEDDDGFWRLRREHVRIVRYAPSIGSYRPLRHKKYGKNFPRVDRGLSIVKHSTYRRHDGLTTVDYKIHDIKKELFFTRIRASVDGPIDHKHIRQHYVAKINEIRMKMDLPVFDANTLEIVES